MREEQAANLTQSETHVFHMATENKPKIYNCLQHLTLDEIWRRYPRACELTDPQHFVFDIQPEISMWKFICRRPLE
jgi:hypothetical protein